MFLKNRFKKTVIIISASYIEILFGDFFNALVLNKLGKSGSEKFLNRYNHASIQECIDISNSFIDDSLRESMDNIKKGFFDKWKTLRNDRNSIVHSNNKYISLKRVSDIYKLIDESTLVFSKLKSNLYKENYKIYEKR